MFGRMKTCMNDESAIFHDDTVAMHHHAAVLSFTDPPAQEETDLTVESNIDDAARDMMSLFPDLRRCHGQCHSPLVLKLFLLFNLKSSPPAIEYFFLCS